MVSLHGRPAQLCYTVTVDIRWREPTAVAVCALKAAARCVLLTAARCVVV
jgi:hypothetical protein